MVATKTDSLHPESSKRIRSVIADHREMSRYGMRRLMEDAPDFAVVGEAGDAAAALRLVLDHHPDWCCSIPACRACRHLPLDASSNKTAAERASCI